MILFILACDILDSIKYVPDADTADAPPASGSVYSSMPYASESSRVNWNCEFLVNEPGIGETGLEEYGVIAIHAYLAAALYRDAGVSGWEYAWMMPEVVDGEVEYDGIFYPMGRGFLPDFLTAAVSDEPVDMTLCRGYLWVESGS